MSFARRSPCWQGGSQRSQHSADGALPPGGNRVREFVLASDRLYVDFAQVTVVGVGGSIAHVAADVEGDVREGGGDAHNRK